MAQAHKMYHYVRKDYWYTPNAGLPRKDGITPVKRGSPCIRSVCTRCCGVDRTMCGTDLGCGVDRTSCVQCPTFYCGVHRTCKLS